MSYQHLDTKTLPLLDLTDDERIAYIRTPRWIGYEHANSILEQLQELLRWPKVSRMPNYIVLGDTNNGKSMLLEHFTAINPPVSLDEDMVELEVPVIYTQAPTKPNESALYSAILNGIGVVHNPRANSLALQSQVIKVLTRLKTKVLIVDELHNLIVGATKSTQQCMVVLKWLSNELKIPIIAAGINSALTAVRHDEQLANRFKVLRLDRWKMDKSFARLLKSYETILPLRKSSSIATPESAQLLLQYSDGLIGEVSKILEQASVEAIKSGKEFIDIKLLKTMNWESPAEREASR